MIKNKHFLRAAFFTLSATLAAGIALPSLARAQGMKSGASAAAKSQGSSADWSKQAPGDSYLVSAADLPQPGATESSTNRSKLVPKPADASLQVPAGFKVEQIVSGLENARQIVTAPNGDLFLSESDPGRIRVLRLGSDGKLAVNQEFASGLAMPYGIAFYPPGPNPSYIYVGNTNSVVRFPYKNGDVKASGAAEKIADLPGGSKYGGGHWTRNLAFSKDGKKLYVAVGSKANISDNADEKERAGVLEFNPDGSGRRVYASGLRNPSGLAVNPTTGQVWVSVNERDLLGDNLVPDYVTHIVDGGFYGWPWYYIGPNVDSRVAEKPELKSKVVVPDVLLQSHSAPLSVAFYNGSMFPRQYREGAFVTSHGSWNRANRTGNKIIFIPTSKGKATGKYMDFVTGFVVNNSDVWGRPVGVTVARDGSLIFTDDGSNSVWRVTYQGNKEQARAQ